LAHLLLAAPATKWLPFAPELVGLVSAPSRS